MPGDWHVNAGGQRRGPLDERQLRELARSGFLKPFDQVWQAGSPQWAPASSVPGLFSDDAPNAKHPALRMLPPTVPEAAAPSLLPPVAMRPAAQQTPQSAPPLAPMLPPSVQGYVAPQPAMSGVPQASAVPRAASVPQAASVPPAAPMPPPSFSGGPLRRRASGSLLMTVAALILGAAGSVYIYLHYGELVEKILHRHLKPEAGETDDILTETSNDSPSSSSPQMSNDAGPSDISAQPDPPSPVRSANALDAVVVVRVQVTERSPRICTGFTLGDSRHLVTCLSAIRPDRPVGVVFADGGTATVDGFVAALPSYNLVLLRLTEPAPSVLKFSSAPARSGDDVTIAGAASAAGGFATLQTQLRNAVIDPAIFKNSSGLAPAQDPETTYIGGPLLDQAGGVVGALVESTAATPVVVDRQSLADLRSSVSKLRPLRELPPVAISADR